MQFLDGREAERKVRLLLRSCRWARVAVSYWGDGACSRLGLGEVAHKDIVVSCDVRSGGCNSTEVRLLQSIFGHKRVLTRDRLHAKVWLTDIGAVLGSSNASSNGFGTEGRAAAGLIEANVFLGPEDQEALSEIKDWYEAKVWSASREIDDGDLQEGDRQRDKRVKGSRTSSVSVLDALKNNRKAYAGRNFYVWIYPFEDPPKHAEERFLEEASRRSIRGLDYWTDAELPPGSFVIEFDSSRNKIEYEGSFRVLDRKHIVRYKRGSLLLCEPARTILGATLGSPTDWCKAATRSIRGRSRRKWEGTLHEFAKFLM